MEETGQILLPILLCGGILISGFCFVLADADVPVRYRETMNGIVE